MTAADESGQTLVVNCPHCSRPVPWTDSSTWKPFCSERCRMIDLGDWLSEKHAIPDNDAGLPQNADTD